MKKLFLLVFLFTLSINHLSAQFVQKGISDDEIAERFEIMKKDFVEKGNEWGFTKIVEVANASKDKIYASILDVMANTYVDSKEVIQTSDKDAGLVIAKGFVDSEWRKINFATNTMNRCWQVIKFDIKDNRFRITLNVSSIWSQLNDNGWSENSLKDNYPYNQRWPAKGRWWSFNNLIFAYDCSMQMLEYLNSEISKKLTDDNDW